jgi:predicted nucleotidyltransferase
MYSDRDINIIKEIVVAAVPDVAGIFLFGSHARGTARETSDIDIAILLERDLDWRERHSVLNRLYGDTARLGYNVDFLLKRADVFRRDSALPTISRVISREGRLLWTKN